MHIGGKIENEDISFFNDNYGDVYINRLWKKIRENN